MTKLQQLGVGCILGAALGDAIGLPYEGLSRRRGSKLLGPPRQHRLCLGRGMVSDDTEHICMVAQALIASGADVEHFRRDLAWRLRWWLLGLPAGVGLATLKAIAKLWLGANPRDSGVFSAGNGPAMRAAVIGVAVTDVTRLRAFVRASTRLTHTDPKAEYGAFAVALAARFAAQGQLADSAGYLSELRRHLQNDEAVQDGLQHTREELFMLLAQAAASAEQRQSTQDFAAEIGSDGGVSGYIYRSVPVALQACFLHRDDFRSAIAAIVECGGDTDSVGAIAGGIIGCAIPADELPQDWLSGMMEWPRSVRWMEQLGNQLNRVAQTGIVEKPLQLFPLSLLVRNFGFLGIVLFHGFRRLLPPY